VQFNADTIRADLHAELPQYVISSYGAAKSEPNLLFGYDKSPEELRWESMLAARDGRAQVYVCVISLVSHSSCDYTILFLESTFLSLSC
jgi:hypothetical protein